MNNSPKQTRIPKTPKTPNKGDRFIPSRSGMDLDVSHYNLTKENCNPNMIDTISPSPSKEGYNKVLAESLFDGQIGSKVLAFKSKAPVPKETSNLHRVLYASTKIVTSETVSSKKVTRHIASNAERILDAPNLVNDYYLNLIDWSMNNILAIALSDTCYLWNAATGEISELMKTTEESNIITSLSFAKEGGNIIAIGTNDGKAQLWDINEMKYLRMMQSHSARIGVMDWNSHVLTTGSRDTTIAHNDVRVANYRVGVLQQHSQEVCGLKWSLDNQLASGSNDNTVCLWNGYQTTPQHVLTQHQAAVKALAWCPWQKDLLATGAGTADRHIRFWNTTTGSLLNSIDTNSQVSSLIWSKNPNCKEIVSSHGFSQNQLSVWKYPSLVKIADLNGHEQRILCTTMSPDGKTIVSAAGDETLRFWNVFDVEEKVKTKSGAVHLSRIQSTSLAKSIR